MCPWLSRGDRRLSKPRGSCSQNRAALLLLLWVPLVSGCGTRSAPDIARVSSVSPTWQPVSESAMTPSQAGQRDRAIAARDALLQRLLGRLTEVLGADGPAEAIHVCKNEARQLAAQVSEEHGLALGRTSFRLRNPQNQPPDWAEPLVAERVEEPVFLTREGRFAAFLPIRVRPECLICHGAREGIPAEVSAALAAQYPDDEATGFRADDLRGWVWVEMAGVASAEQRAQEDTAGHAE